MVVYVIIAGFLGMPWLMLASLIRTFFDGFKK